MNSHSGGLRLPSPFPFNHYQRSENNATTASTLFRPALGQADRGSLAPGETLLKLSSVHDCGRMQARMSTACLPARGRTAGWQHRRPELSVVSADLKRRRGRN